MCQKTCISLADIKARMYVYVLPDQDLVVVRMGLTENADIDIFLSGILESIK